MRWVCADVSWQNGDKFKNNHTRCISRAGRAAKLQEGLQNVADAKWVQFSGFTLVETENTDGVRVAVTWELKK